MFRQFVMRTSGSLRRFGTVAENSYQAAVGETAAKNSRVVDEKTLLLLKEAQKHSPSSVMGGQAREMSKKEWEEFSAQSAALRKRSSVY